MKEERVQRRGRPAKAVPNPDFITKAIIDFLQSFMTETLAKRIVGMVLVAMDIPNARITKATGLSDRSIWNLKKEIRSGNTDSLFNVGHGSGRVGKAAGFEAAIAEEVETNNYHTRQQIADMIREKFGINMSVSAVGRLLKKTACGG